MMLVEENKLEGDCFQDAARIVCNFLKWKTFSRNKLKILKLFSEETTCSFVPVLGMEISFSNPYLCLLIFYWIK